MKQLASYLLNHIVLDFDGEVDMEVLNALLVEDGGKVAHDLRARLIAEKGPTDFLLVLADCLKEFIREGINEELIGEQIEFYLDS